MTEVTDRLFLPLFVPGDRPERFAKACASGADAVIIDLEDAVSPTAKDRARTGLAAAVAALEPLKVPLIVRVNAAGTAWHDADLSACAALPLAAVMLAKTENSMDVRRVASRTGIPVIALIESAAGLAAAAEIAVIAARLAFGTIDFAADIGSAHTREALLFARSQLVVASRIAHRASPLDGVTTAIHDTALVEDEARYSASLGFGGKLLVHPAQIAPARRGLYPTEAEILWARKVLAATDGSAIAIDGAMVDAPVVARAERILKRQA